MLYEDLAKSYVTKSDDELLRLALQPELLTQDASTALTSELVKRGINGAERLNIFREHEKQRKEKEAKNPGSLFLPFHYGIGRWHLGKADYKYDSKSGIEQFKTTIFILVFWFPLIPTGSYLVQKKRGYFGKRIVILKKLPFDWGQVFKIWGVATIGLVILIWALTRI
jgi:hypothetical protein